ncbi:cadherin-like beta sandwich domain-containing protein [Paenibacillus sp. MBLB4367]|uniref:cadherin-like beta sandwich domain-containing protein n=1 Tax=Paenibacillus sp. MBLB4367 TaxID=3384767 RepID=UPI00390828B3
MLRSIWVGMLVIVLLAAGLPAGAKADASATATSVSAGRGPHAVAVNPATSRVYAANAVSDDVTVMEDTYGGFVTVATVGVGTTPYAIAVNPATNKIYVANADSDNVTVIDGATNETVTVPVGKNPFAVAVNPATNNIYVANVGSGDVTVIDGATNGTITVPAGKSPFALAVNETTNKIYVANIDGDSVTVIDGTTHAAVTIPAGAGPSAIAVNPITDRVYAANFFSGSITVIEGATGTTSTVTVGKKPNAVDVNPATNKIYVANAGSGNVTVIDGVDNSTSFVSVGSGPSALAVHAAANKIYVANYDSHNVTAIDGTNHQTSLIPAGKNPIALAVDSPSNKIYVANFNGDTLTIIEELRATDADLSGLTISAGSLSPAFDPGINEYSVLVGHEVAAMTVTATTYDPSAAISITGQVYGNSAVVPVSLQVGANVLPITVLAADGLKSKTYTLTVYRADVTGSPLTANADLSQLTVSAGTLQPAFAAGRLAYSDDVGHTVASVSVTAVTYAPGTTMQINGQTHASGVSFPVSLQVGVNPVTIVTTAEDGAASKTYVVTINRAGVSVVTEEPEGGTTTAPLIAKPEPGDMTVGQNGVTLSNSAATITAGTDGNGRSAITAMLRADSLSKAFGLLKDKAKEGQTVTFELPGSESLRRVGIPARALVDAANAAPHGVITIKVHNASYTLPVNMPVLASFLQQPDKELDKAVVFVTMETVTGALAERAAELAKAAGITLAGDLVEFTLTVEANGSKHPISDYGSMYVTRSLILAGVVDPSRATAVLVDPVSGTLSFVPSVFTTVNGITAATIYRTGSSLYAVIRLEKSFADLREHWSKRDVELLASKLIVKGMTETSFAPEINVTRGEFVSLIVRALGLAEDSANAKTFSDISASDWFAGAVGAAAKAHIVNGFENGTFRPGETITREQMAVILSGALTFAGKPPAAAGKLTLYAFEDHTAIRSWAEASAVHMVQNGILSGMTETRFAPQEPVTRAQAAVAIKRLLQAAGFIN